MTQRIKEFIFGKESLPPHFFSVIEESSIKNLVDKLHELCRNKKDFKVHGNIQLFATTYTLMVSWIP